MALIDFSDPKELACWSAINDAVMGGRYRSRMHFDPAGHAVFSGTVSSENNGGLASVRRQPGDLGTARAPYRKDCRSAPLSTKRQVTDAQLTAKSRLKDSNTLLPLFGPQPNDRSGRTPGIVPC
jgi:hypothetical protein